MEDTGVIDISPDEATFGSTKSHIDSSKNKLVSAYEFGQVYDKSDAPGSSSANSLQSTHPENAFNATTDLNRTQKKLKKIHSENTNSSKEETSFDYTMPYPTNPSYSDYEDGTAGVPSYDYQDYQLGEPVVRLPYDFSGLQFSKLSEAPRVWNSQNAFLEQVGYKLYMFIPAGLAGILLGAFLWIIAMIILRAYGVAKKSFLRFIQKEDTEDLEMGPSCHAKESEKNKSEIKKIHPVKKLSRHVCSDYFTSRKVAQLIPNEKSSIQKNRLENNEAEKSASSQSTQSSPVSLSSGIGVSERESGDERDSLASCKEFENFERGVAGNWDTRTGQGGQEEVGQVTHGGEEDTVVYRVDSLSEKCCRRNSD
eukprot:TRINITY_DN12491_c0_g1_i1.p1 TRINITY_DN12491_c0_g1~~TRINITY_DN12491_c0_g1_i1.p1  ORF type:complete len:367 (-),score=104.18 TRINITY_DN12491_c0_g1_i1:323-1423(-)